MKWEVEGERHSFGVMGWRLSTKEGTVNALKKRKNLQELLQEKVYWGGSMTGEGQEKRGNKKVGIKNQWRKRGRSNIVKGANVPMSWS